MTYGEIVILSFVGTLAALALFVAIDIWLTHRKLVRERERKESMEQDLFRKLYDQAIADSFRPQR